MEFIPQTLIQSLKPLGRMVSIKALMEFILKDDAADSAEVNPLGLWSGLGAGLRSMFRVRVRVRYDGASNMPLCQKNIIDVTSMSAAASSEHFLFQASHLRRVLLAQSKPYYLLQPELFSPTLTLKPNTSLILTPTRQATCGGCSSRVRQCARWWTSFWVAPASVSTCFLQLEP